MTQFVQINTLDEIETEHHDIPAMFNLDEIASLHLIIETDDRYALLFLRDGRRFWMRSKQFHILADAMGMSLT